MWGNSISLDILLGAFFAGNLSSVMARSAAHFLQPESEPSSHVLIQMPASLASLFFNFLLFFTWGYFRCLQYLPPQLMTGSYGATIVIHYCLQVLCIIEN